MNGAGSTPAPQMRAQSLCRTKPEQPQGAQIKQVFLVRLCVSPRGPW